MILKLIALQLFDEAIATLQITRTDLRILPTAKFVFQKKRKQKSQYPDEIWARVIHLVETCSTISDLTPDRADEAKQLESFRDDIHEGETALILATLTESEFLLLSGDKKCMKALPAIPETIYKRLCGRVVCLEQLILRLIDVRGFEWVKVRSIPAREYDKALKACFGSGEKATESNVRQALEGYIQDVRNFAPGLLLDPTFRTLNCHKGQSNQKKGQSQ